MDSLVTPHIVNEEVYKQFIQSRSSPESDRGFRVSLMQRLRLPDISENEEIAVPEDRNSGTAWFRLLEYRRSEQGIFATVEFLRFEE